MSADTTTRIHNKWSIFLVVAVGVFMATLDSSMVNVALPTIMREFKSPLHQTEWVALIYLLTITSTLLFWGNLSDRLGRGRIYSQGMLVFALGSLFCYTSPTLAWLIFSRFLQAIGAAMMMAIGPAIIKDTFPKEQLGRSLGLIGIAVSLGLMTGPAIGGYLIEFASWRAIFLLTVPFGFTFYLLGRLLIPPKTDPDTPQRFDWPGGLIWILILTLATISLTHAGAQFWSPILTGTTGGAALLLLPLFLWLEKRAASPLLPLTFFTHRFFWVGISCALISFLVLFVALILTPFFLDHVLNLSGSRLGLVMMAVPVSVMVVGPLSGWLYDRIGGRHLTTLGMLISAGGLILLAAITPTTPAPLVALRLALLGCGQALFLSPNSASILQSVQPKHTGAVAALIATARNLGMLLGIALAGLVFAFSFKIATNGLDLKDFTPQHLTSFMQALRNAYLTAAGIGLLGAALSWLRPLKSTKL